MFNFFLKKYCSFFDLLYLLKYYKKKRKCLFKNSTLRVELKILFDNVLWKEAT